MAMKEVLKDQIQRNRRNIQLYEKKMKELPKGSIHPKIINGKKYYYLKYRNEDGKRVDQYIKEKDLDELIQQLKKRAAIQKMVKEMKNDIRIAEKGLKYAIKREKRKRSHGD